MSSSLPLFLSRLTPDGLATWAGEAVFQRGLAYYKKGKVLRIARSPEGGLLATVDGRRSYATLLFQEQNGDLASLCTCPYGPRCKHSIALACAGLALLAEKTAVPVAAADDKRLLDLEIHTFPDKDPAGQVVSPQALNALLESFSKEKLIALVMQAIRLTPEVAALCVADDAEIPHKDVHSLVKDVRRAMRSALQNSDRYSDWIVPDYEPVRKRLEILRLAGFPSEVLDLGLELLEESARQMELYDVEGEIHDAVARCMESALQALHDVDWPLSRKLLWAVDAVLKDEFAVCECFGTILEETHGPEAWNSVADTLLQRLARHEENDFFRHTLIGMVIHALAEAGRETDIFDLRRQEAVEYGEYLPFVEYLISRNQDEKAEEWIEKGLSALGQKDPYRTERLRLYLLELKKKQEDWDGVLCMQTEYFVRSASVKLFEECRRTAEKLGVWPFLRPLLIDFLTERKIPWTQGAWPCRNRGCNFVYPKTEEPDFKTLIKIYISENNPKEVLKWYDLQYNTKGYADDTDAVADSVCNYAPDRSISMWKELAETQIALVKPAAYMEAASFLRKAGKLLCERGMKEQWESYIQLLRNIHRRKTRLMEILDNLTFAEDRFEHRH